jgi:hypothetical protein
MTLMHIIAFIAIIVDCFVAGWLESVGSRVIYELDYKKPILRLYVVPIQNILDKLPVVPVGDTGTIPHRMRNLLGWTPFRALPATADRAQAMGAGCGSSTRGHWDGPVTCNKSHGIPAREAAGRKVPCEHDAMFGPCYRLPRLWLSSDDSTWFSRKCLGRLNIRPIIGLCSVQLV